MTRYQDQYRIESTRLQAWDYSSPGFYYVTIVTKGRLPWFGKIINKELVLSPLGEIIAEE